MKLLQRCCFIYSVTSSLNSSLRVVQVDIAAGGAGPQVCIHVSTITNNSKYKVLRVWMIIELLQQQQGCTGTHSCCIHTQLPSLLMLFFKTLTLAPQMLPSNLNLNAVGVTKKLAGLSTFH